MFFTNGQIYEAFLVEISFNKDGVDIYPLPGTFLGQYFGESYELVSFGGVRNLKA